MKKDRLLRVIKNNLIILLLGMIYAVICTVTGYGIPCMFKSITGLNCAGCGVTRMCLELIHLNVHSAFLYNEGLFCLMPFIAYAYIHSNVVYVRTGEVTLGKVGNLISYMIIAALIIWSIYRNIVGI